MQYLILDFETYYSPDDGYTLRKLSIPEYIGHKDFAVHCLGVEYLGVKKILWGDENIRKWLSRWSDYDGDYCFVFHNAYFDLAVLKWWYDFTPDHALCTLLMANHVLGPAKESGGKNSVEALAERMGLESKGRLDFMEGVRKPDAQQRQLLEVYLNTDLSLGRQIFDRLLPHIANPDTELWLIDHTLKTYTEKPMVLNMGTVDRAERLIEARRATAFEALGRVEGFRELPREQMQDIVSSPVLFKDALTDMMRRYNMPLPTKVRKTTLAEFGRFNMLQGKAKESEEAREKFHAYALRMVQSGGEVWEDGNELKLGNTKRVPALAKKDEDFIRLSFSKYEGINALVNARLIEKSADTNAGRLAKMRRVAGGLGIMPVYLVYYGAHTGRWSGGGGFNYQNMANPDREPDPGKRAIASCIREAFEAPPGYVFLSADSSQGECRGSAWIAGQWDLLDDFRQGIDVYCKFISEVLGEEIYKPKGDESPERQSHLKLMRHIGKEARLALSYQMWVNKFVARLKEDPKVAQMFIDGDLTVEFCKDVVLKYREINTAIVSCWAELESAFKYALAGGTRMVGPLTFRKGIPIASKLPVVDMYLPSGRVLHYRDVRRRERKADDMRAGDELIYGIGKGIYGGKLLENATQGLIGDVLRDSIIRAETERGLPVSLNVHDSVVCLSPDETAEANLNWLVGSMKQTPTWADDRLFLGAEGKAGKTLVM